MWTRVEISLSARDLSGFDFRGISSGGRVVYEVV